MKTIPYTYCLTHKLTGKRYYGVRYKNGCNPNDLWKNYFSSSEIVKQLIDEDGINSFIAEVRKTFNTKLEAINWEKKVLKRLKVTHNDMWLNQNHGCGSYGMTDKTHSEETKKLMSEKQSGKNNPMYGRTHTGEALIKISEASKGRIYSEEAKRNFSAAAKARGISKSTRDASLSDESNKKRSHTLLGHFVSSETKKKISARHKGKRWFNDGEKSILTFEAPNKNYVLGRLPIKKGF